MNWKLQITCTLYYLLIISACMLLIPQTAPLFGMGLIPAPMTLTGTVFIPAIALIAISVQVYKQADKHRLINTVSFLVAAVLLWIGMLLVLT